MSWHYHVIADWSLSNKLVHIAQSVASLIADPDVMSSIPARPHILVEIYHEIISTVIILLSLIQEGLLSVISESMCTEYWLSA